jgi:hypothetical protein
MMSAYSRNWLISLPLALIVASFVQAQTPIADWSFSNGSTLLNLEADSSGNSYNLTEQGSGIGFDPLALGGAGAATFNGSGFFNFGESFPGLLPTLSSSYSITAWINPGLISPSAYGIIGWGNYFNQDQTNAFRTDSNGGIVNYSWSDDNVYDPPGFNVYDGQWHFVAVTFDNTSGNRYLYIDPVTSGLVPHLDTPNNTPFNDHLNVGAANFAIGKTCDCDLLYTGEMSQVEVFNTALTSSQIDALASPEPGTLVLAIPAIGLMWLRRRSTRRSA